MALFPDTSRYPESRLFCLDLLRGLDIFALTMLMRNVWAMERVWKFPVWLQQQFDHTWGVFSFVDCTQPLFIFICGAAVPFAMSRRLTPDGRATAAFWKHVAWRVFMLWTVGMVLHGGLLTLDPSRFTVYNGTLQTIALGYLAAALAMLLRSLRLRAAIAAVLIAIPAVLQIWYGDYTETGNLSRVIDGRFIAWCSAHLGYVPIQDKPFCYVLTTLTWCGMGIVGSLAAECLRGKAATEWAKAKRLLAWGAGLLACGLALVPWVPANRYIYTLPFVLISMGLSILALDGLFVACDVKRHRAHLGFFVLFGRYALLAWCMHTLLRPVMECFASVFVQGAPRILGTDRFMPILTELVLDVIFTGVLVVRHRLNRPLPSAEESGK